MSDRIVREQGEYDYDADDREPARSPRRVWTLRALGLGLAALVYVAMGAADLSQDGRVVATIATLMAVWWMTEAIPLSATALIPLVALPSFTGLEIGDATAPYADPIVFLFLGGFLIAIAMQKWNLHRRIALRKVSLMGTRPAMVVAGFMIATGFLSMWVSNTATAVMMLPIGVSVLALVATLSDDVEDPGEDGAAVRSSPFGTALVLGIAYAASIGSLATIIGTPPNTLLVGYLEDAHDISIGFGQWMLAGLPLAVIFLTITWVLLTKVFFRPEIDDIPGGRELIRDELEALGPMSRGEIRVTVIFVLAALSWVFVPLVSDWLGASPHRSATPASPWSSGCCSSSCRPGRSPGSGCSTGRALSSCPGASCCSSAGAWRSPGSSAPAA